MTNLLRNLPNARWRTALRAGALAVALAVVAGAPLAAQAREGDHGGWRGHEHHEWHEHGWRGDHPYWGYYGPRSYAPAYGYYAPGYAPGLTVTIP